MVSRTALATLIRAAAMAVTCLVAPLPAAAAAASAGDASAQFALAVRYEHAEGVPRDYAHALELYCAAAGQGHADASFNIAWIYLNGRGVARDDVNGAAWLRVAAGRGHPLAERLLARLGAVAAAKPTGCRAAEPASPARSAGATVPPKEIARLVAESAAANKLDPKLVLAVIATESAFRSAALSPRNAGGLMQLMPETAERFGVKNVFDARENIQGGSKYLRWLLDYFDGDLSLALAAYNAGEGAVTRYGGVPPFAETRAYVEKIRALYKPEPRKAEPRAERIAMR
jgi:soluble lytic murein transglycosylase-like protein